jgi:hypothetical protein
VSGLISDASYSVSVNGVQGTNNGDGTWNAASVPVSAGGVASFDMKASSGGGDRDGNMDTNKLTRLYEESDTQNMNTYGHWRDTLSADTNPADAYYWEEDWLTNHFDQAWGDEIAGVGYYFNREIGQVVGNPASTNVWAEQMSWPATNWVNWGSIANDYGTGLFSGTAFPTNLIESIDPPVLTGVDFDFFISGEHCSESDPYGPTYTYGPYDGGWDIYEEDGTYTRHAQTKWKLKTGGKALPRRQSLFCISGSAKDVEAAGDKRAAAPFEMSYEGSATALGSEPYLPSAAIAIGSLGNLDTNGNLWVVLPDGATPYDVTPQVGKNFYIYWVNEQKVIPDVQLAADVSHTKNLSFDSGNVTSQSNPFRFWVNDDDDSGDIGNTDVPGSGSNGSSGHVNGRGDVIDFFPVGVRIGTPNLTPPDAFEYRLKGAGLYYVYTEQTTGNAYSYLTETASTGTYGSSSNSPACSADTVKADGGAALNSTFTNLVCQNGGGVLLMEAASPVSPGSPLQLQVYYHGKQIFSTNLYLSISGVEAMYRQINLRSGYSGPAAAPANNPDSLSSGNMLVFIHGFSVTANDARGWNAEMFKRLYQAGSHAMFTGIDWQGDDHPWFDLTGHSDYYDNVKNAFMTASNFNVAVSALPGQHKYVVAHSLGNMVASSAVKDFGLSVDKYLALNAAVATEAYDGGSGNLQMVNPDASSYPPPWTNYDQGLWASGWYQLFPTNDGRHNLTWINRFGIIGNFYNYYSPGENVLHPTDGNYHSPLSVWWYNEFAWTCQEMSKGDTASGLFSSISQAGWAFNSDYDVILNNMQQHMPTNQATTALQANPGQFQTDPFFARFNNTNLMNNTTGSAEAAKFDVRAEVLAGGIPALSNPTGASSVNGFSDNIDMMHRFENGWPKVRTDDNSKSTRWLHSDFKYVAFPFNHGLYDDIVGKLND